MDENKKLLPCPFCGGEAEFVTDEYTANREILTMWFHIECAKCHTESPMRDRIEARLGKDGEIKIDVDERMEILEFWNRRTCSCEKHEERQDENY